MKNLLHEKGLCSGGWAGGAKASLREGTMELRERNAGQAVGPHKIPHNLPKSDGCGCWKRKNLGKVPSLRDNKHFQDLDSSEECGQPPASPGLQGALEAIKDLSPGSKDRGSKGGENVKSKNFDTSGCLHPLQRPVLAASPGHEAKNHQLLIPEEDGSSSSLQLPGDGVHP